MPASGPFSWVTPPRILAFVCVLVLASHGDVATGLGTFYFRDFMNFGYPLAHYLKESLGAGQIPLWNPFSNCGLPFLAQWNTMALYPGSAFFVLLPLPWSLNLFVLLHQVLAGVGMFLLARRLAGCPAAAALAGCGFAFSGLLEHSLMWPNNMAGLGWMPWVVLALQGAASRRRRAVLAAIAAGAMQMLCGAPEITFFTWLVGIVLLLADSGAWREAWRRLGAAALTFAGVALIAAAQLLPFLDFLRHANRNAGFSASSWAMPLSGLANFFLPAFAMREGAPGILSQPGQFWTSSYYVSLPLLVLALVAAASNRRLVVRGLAIVAVAGLVLALGDNGLVYRWLRQASGLLGWVRFPVKWVVVTTFCLPLLAAHAFAGLSPGTAPWTRRWRSTAFLALASGGLVVGLLVVSLRLAEAGVTGRRLLANGLGRLLLVGAVLGLFFLAHRAGPSRRSGLLLAACLVLVWVDMRSHLPDYTPVVPAAALAPRPRPADSAPRLGTSRALVDPLALATLSRLHLPDRERHCSFKRAGLFANLNLLDGIPKVDGFFSLYPGDSFRVVSALYARPAPLSPAAAGLLDFLAVTQVSLPDRPERFVSRDGAMGWVSAGQQPVFVSDEAALGLLLEPGFDPRRQVLLPVAAAGRLLARGPQPVSISDQQISVHRLRFTAAAEAPALAVIAQSHYPAWRATVNGRRASVWRANVGFQAVEIPAGTSRIQLDYDDRMFRAGAVLSLFGLLAWSAAWWPGWRRRTGPPPPPHR